MAAGKFRGGGGAEKGRQETFLSGHTHFFWGKFRGERKDRKLTAAAAREMEVRSKEELPGCEGLDGAAGRGAWSQEGWRDIKAG